MALLGAGLLAGCSSAGSTGSATRPTSPTAGAGHSLLVSDVSSLSGVDQITFTALQGLVNRAGPEVYLDGFPDNPGNPNTRASREILTDLIGRPRQQVSPYSLLERYKGEVKGLIVWDPSLLVDTENVATSLAGLDDALPVSPAMAGRLEQSPYHLKVLVDLRTEHFTSRDQAYAWALRYKGGARNYAFPAWIGDNNGDGRGNEPWLRDWVVAHHGFAFEADPITEQALIHTVLGSFPQNTPVYGYIFYADAYEKAGGTDIEEPIGVGEISAAGDYLIPSVTATNLTVLSQIPATPAPLTWDQHPETPEAGKVYVTFVISDGDNIGSDETELLVNQWNDPDRGKIPMGVSVSAQFRRLAPTLYAHLTETTTGDDVLVAAPSGAGYAYPSKMPDLDRYLTESRTLMDKAGLRAVWILDNLYVHSPDQATVDAYARYLRPSAIFSDYDDIQGNYLVPNPPAISFAGRTPVVHDVWGLSVAGTVKAVRATVAAAHGRPAFVFVGLNIWTMGYPQALAVMRQLGSGYVVVRPDRFMGLVEGAKAEDLLAPGQLAP